MSLVLVNGCFDMLHVGHVRFLEWAARFGDVFVALNSDASIRSIKGPQRPIVPEDHRRELLLALRCVTDVFLFDEPTPDRMIQQLCPNVIVVGCDHRLSDAHYQAAERRGVLLKQAPTFQVPRCSEIVARIRETVPRGA